MFDFSDELKEVIYLPTLRCNYKKLYSQGEKNVVK